MKQRGSSKGKLGSVRAADDINSSHEATERATATNPNEKEIAKPKRSISLTKLA
jgi:hypothetical protein